MNPLGPLILFPSRGPKAISVIPTVVLLAATAGKTKRCSGSYKRNSCIGVPSACAQGERRGPRVGGREKERERGRGRGRGRKEKKGERRAAAAALTGYIRR